MNNRTIALRREHYTRWCDYLELCKPRVVLLMMLTTMVGMCLSTSTFVPFNILLWGNLGIALAASSAAVINQLVDAHFDRLMSRTQGRPIVSGKIAPRHAMIFASVLCVVAMLILIYLVNTLTAVLTFVTLIGYAVIYTSFLKHVTAQNIVIGGAAGAAPPLLGWVAVTGQVDAGGLILMMIIFVWTPPHFWALAIHRVDDYAKANIPMLPNRFGIPFTQLSILLYVVLLMAVTLLPFAIGMSGWIYLLGAFILNGIFLYYALALWFSERPDLPMKTFRYSIIYLMLLFVMLLVDHYL
ncbi:MAG: protoheme IX farnesyltransferase [Coxiella sp. RIFCSPHIGHO2_12_FULL_42_15]|nr:MAG: protoheme IX farnesyltransferase [Coxiella sp. RIFCSPHIGHO2_12_FULL_42_15]